MSTCEFCNSILSTRGAVKSHQKSARYCIEIQKSLNVSVVFEEQKCEFCARIFTRKETMKIHEITCKRNKKNNPELLNEEISILKKEYEDRINEEISNMKKEYEDRIQKLQSENTSLKVKIESTRGDIYEKLNTKKDDCIEKIAAQPKITASNTTNTNTNNILNNMPCLNTTLEQLTEAANDKFDINLFMQGQAGAAIFFLNHIKEINDGTLPLMVSDRSRGIIKYKNENKEIIADHHARLLTQLVSDAIKIKNQQHYDSFYKGGRRIKKKKQKRNEDSSDNERYDSDEEINYCDNDCDNDSNCSDGGNNSDDIREQQADQSYMAIKKMTRDNKGFRKKIIEETMSSQ